MHSGQIIQLGKNLENALKTLSIWIKAATYKVS